MKRILIILIAMFPFFSCGKKAALPYETDKIAAPGGGEVEIVFIKHGSLALNYKDFHIQIDPVSKQDGMTVDYSKFPKADLILVTHDHFDHLDPDAVKTLQKGGTRIILPRSSCEKLGFGEVVAEGDRIEVDDDVCVDVVPAYNTTEDHMKFHPKGYGVGYILTIAGLKVYVAGDTELIPEMAALADEKLDAAFLPVNQPYTMTVAQCLDAARLIRPRILYPYHYSETPVRQVADSLADSSIEVRIRQMQ